MAQSAEKDVGVFGRSSPLNFDWAYFATFKFGLLFLWLLLIAVAYFGWRYYQNECIDKKSNEKISQKVAEEMAKKIKEDAEMHRKGRKEGEE